MRKVVIAGASGLVGGQVARLLTDVELHLVTRRNIDGVSPQVMQHVADSDGWAEITTALRPDVAISCLGTTIAKAGSKPAFSAIDLDLVLAFATAAKEGGAGQMISVSSVGADAAAANFYLSVKGKAEQGLRELGFERLDILRPGLLRGDRQEQRTGEGIAMLLSPLTDMLLHGPLRRYRSIDSAQVARAIVKLLGETPGGQFIHENDAIATLAS